MQKPLVLSVLVIFALFICPLDILFAEAPPAYTVAHFEGKHIQWKVVFSPTGGDIKEEVPFEVAGQHAQVIMGIGNLKDLSKDLEKVRLTATDGKGRAIGADRDAAETSKKLGLKEFPTTSTFAKIDKALKEAPKVKAGETPSFDLAKIATNDELAKAQEEYIQKLKGGKDFGFVAYGQKRFEGKGLKAFNIVNPSATGTWKLNVEGKKGEPFWAVALSLPLELTEQAKGELAKGYESIFDQLKNAYPTYQEWGSCDKCCNCKSWVDLSGVVFGVVALIAGMLTGGTGTIATLAGMITLIAIEIGALASLYAAATLIYSACKNCNWDCWVGAMPTMLCYGFNKCNKPKCC